MEFSFAAKTLFATGAGSGIGRAIAIAFAQAGGRVALVGRSQCGLDEAKSEIDRLGGDAISCQCDVASAAEVEAAAAKTVDAFGAIDCALNCAGVGHAAVAVADIEEEAWDRVFAINAKGLWLCMRAELRLMLPRGTGSIVNVTSSLADHAMPTTGGYVASKHAAAGLTKAAAADYATSGIRINAIAPGPVHTQIIDRVVATMPAEQRETGPDMFAAHVPMKRLGRADELAGAALFLFSDQASYVTGACLAVDGGVSAI